MKKLWLTYAWVDNNERNIDYIVQELDKVGEIEVRFDRRNLIPGQRLWTQIAGHITDPRECDAWAVVLTKASLASEACTEELSYALDRALSSNSSSFPLIGLLHDLSPSALPPYLKVRLCIPLFDNDTWVKQVVAAVNGVAPGYAPSELNAWVLTEHKTAEGYCLEIRPRFDRIAPFAVLVDYDEKSSGNVSSVSPGPAGQVSAPMVAFGYKEGEWHLATGTRAWGCQANNEANSINSYYVFYKKRPIRVWFGHPNKLTRYEYT